MEWSGVRTLRSSEENFKLRLIERFLREAAEDKSLRVQVHFPQSENGDVVIKFSPHQGQRKKLREHFGPYLQSLEALTKMKIFVQVIPAARSGRDKIPLTTIKFSMKAVEDLYTTIRKRLSPHLPDEAYLKLAERSVKLPMFNLDQET